LSHLLAYSQGVECVPDEEQWRRAVKDPLMTSVDLIRYAIAEQVRELGGDEKDVQSIAMTAAYAVWCWTVSEMSRG
jgi:hypothetical protein